MSHRFRTLCAEQSVVYAWSLCYRATTVHSVVAAHHQTTSRLGDGIYGSKGPLCVLQCFLWKYLRSCISTPRADGLNIPGQAAKEKRTQCFWKIIVRCGEWCCPGIFNNKDWGCSSPNSPAEAKGTKSWCEHKQKTVAWKETAAVGWNDLGGWVQLPAISFIHTSLLFEGDSEGIHRL